MNTDYFTRLFGYTEWANRRVWECIMALDEAKFNEPYDPALAPLRNQCIHVMGVEHWWPHFLRTGELNFIDEEIYYPDRTAIWGRWQQVMTANREYVAQLTDDDLQRRVRPEFWEEDQISIFLWEALIQVANHSTDHRAHLMAGLARLGAPTVGQDILGYVVEQHLAAN